MSPRLSRRALLGGFAALAASPRIAFAQGTRVRQPWSQFSQGPQMAPLMSALRQMKGVTNPGDPSGWVFWSEAHRRHCPHGRPYFLAWHRGLLSLLEQKLQGLTGLPDFALPYWDYYAESRMPAAFTQGSAASNPLFHDRENVSVEDALETVAFGPDLIKFQRGQANAFEPEIERLPHNKVHSLIGGDMVTMLSPKDPIFFLHHANIDRLWSAWTAAGGGRSMPAAGDPYWAGDFTYGGGLTCPRAATRDPLGALGYRYALEAFPSSRDKPTPPAPPLRPFAPSFPGGLRPGFFALGPSTSLALGGSSFSTRVGVATSLRARLAPLMRDAPMTDNAIRSVAVVLDQVVLTEAGRRGGFFYDLYVNLPALADGSPRARHQIGSITPFELATVQEHAGPEANVDHDGHEGGGAGPARLVFAATEALRALPAEALSEVTVSFVRVDGQRSPVGTAIEVGSFRIEASSAEIE